MVLSRREFLKILGGVVGGWAVIMPVPSSIAKYASTFGGFGDLAEDENILTAEDADMHAIEADYPELNSSSSGISRSNERRWKRELTYISENERMLNESGHFTEISPKYFVFDENKYSLPKRKLEPSEWNATNRHLPIKIEPGVINKPGERSLQALKEVVAYTKFDNPRYVSAPGERVTMCNIAAWDWSRALQLHLPHWIGSTEMSANMLFRWISEPQAGGAYGEGWQPVNAKVAQLLAARGIPVFALAENSRPRRHGHVAMVYPQKPILRSSDLNGGPYFASVNNGRSNGGNGVKSLRSTFRRLTPTYFVHKHDFTVYPVT